MPKPERDILDEIINSIPVNIERLIKNHGIKLNTNAKREDFTLNKMKQKLKKLNNGENNERMQQS